MKSVILVAALGLLAVLAFNVETVRAGPNDDNEEVQEILAEINALIRKHHKLPPPSARQSEVSPEDKQAADMLDDVMYTVDQAKRMLAATKKRFGYEVRQERIYPNTSGVYWEFPIKYAFNGSQHTEAEKAIIRSGFKLWEDNSCVTVKEYATEEEIGPIPHLLIIKGSGCYSSIGVYKYEGQVLSLGNGCVYASTTAHELGHALGLWHEFMRPDRDDYVKVIWENILPGREHNFEKMDPEDDIDPENTGYDVTSLMHYDSLGFSIDSAGKKRVMMPHDVHQLTAIGQRMRLQFNDIKRVNFAYKCIEKSCKPSQLAKPCQNGGYQDPKNCAACRCPPGTAGVDCTSVAQSSGTGMTGCGGKIYLEPCSIRTLTIPTYPNYYGEEASCTWRITSPAKGLAFAFQAKPDMPCSSADTCYDFVEVRSNMSKLATPGRLFCACGENMGRVVTIDNSGEALVRFSSTTIADRGGAGKRSGFLLNVYATCNDTVASDIKNSCVITSTGFESCSGVSLPLCLADETQFINPTSADTTTATMTTTTARTTQGMTTLAGANVLSNGFVVVGLAMLQIALSKF